MKKVITNYFEVSKLDDQLIKAQFFKNVVIDLDEIHQVLETIESLCEGKSFKLIWILSEYSSFSMEALLLRINHNKSMRNKIIAEAIIVNSIQNRLLERYYMNKNESYYPIRLFKSNLSGEIWLKNINGPKLNFHHN